MKKHILFATLFALGFSGVSASDGASAIGSDPDAIAAQAFIDSLRAMRGESEIQGAFDRLTNGVRAHVCSDANRVRVPVTKRFTLAKICDAWEGKGKAYHTDFSDARGDVAGTQAAVAAAHQADAVRVGRTAVDARGDVSGAKDALAAGSTSAVSSSRDETVRMDPRARAAFSEPQAAAATSKSAATLEAERLAAEAKAKRDAEAARIQAQFEEARRKAAEERLARKRAEFERAQEEARRAREAAEEAERRRAEAEARLARERAAAGKIASAYKGSLEVKAAQAELERLRAERAERDAREAAARSARATDAWARMGAGAKAADKEKRFADARADLADMRAREARAADGLGGLAARLAEKRKADARAEATAMGEARRVAAEARAAEEARLARERKEAAERARLEEEAAAREAAAAEEEARRMEAARAATSADDAAASGGGDGVSAPYLDAYGKSPAEIAALVAQWERDALPLRGSITRFPMTNPGPTVAPDHLRRVAAVAGSFEHLEELFWGWSTAVDDSVVAAFFAGAGSEPFAALSEITFETTVITDGTARSVATAMAAGRLPKLTRLSLSGGAQASNKYGSPVGPKMGGLTEAGALAIVTQLARTPRLTELTLGDEALVAHAAAIEAAARSTRAAAAGPLPELKIRLGGWGEAGKEITLPAKPA